MASCKRCGLGILTEWPHRTSAECIRAMRDEHQHLLRRAADLEEERYRLRAENGTVAELEQECDHLRQLNEQLHSRIDELNAKGVKLANSHDEWEDAARALELERDRLRAELKKYETCQTCDGDGTMDVVVSVDSMGEEQYEPETCAECDGVGIGEFAKTIKERDQLRAEVERLRGAMLECIETQGCVGLDDNNDTCMTQDEWQDEPSRWCSICTLHAAARALEEE